MRPQDADVSSTYGARERKLRRRRTRMPVHGRGVFTLNDLIERGKYNKPARGGKREIVVEPDADERA